MRGTEVRYDSIWRRLDTFLSSFFFFFFVCENSFLEDQHRVFQRFEIYLNYYYHKCIFLKNRLSLLSSNNKQGSMEIEIMVNRVTKFLKFQA